MKICHLTSVHNYKDTRIFIKECKSLAEAGYEVHLIAPDAPTSKIDDVYVHGVEIEKGNRFKRMTRTVNQVYRKGLEIDADVYHFHDPELIPIGLKLKKRGKIVIYDVHEDVPKQILTKNWIPKFLRRPLSWFVENYENKKSQNFDVIVTATEFIKQRFLENKCNAFDIKNYPLLEELKNENIKWSDKGNYVCYIGGISYLRGINEMVQSVNLSNNNIQLFLGGNFVSLVDKESAKEIEGWEKVIELGFLDRVGVRKVYEKSKAGLVTLHPTINYIDALPIKMFEYMAAGIPVISSDFPLWESIIKENKCGICVNPKDPQEISQAIDWIMDNPIEAETMGKSGRRAVERQFNWEVESEKLLKIYNQLKLEKNFGK